MLPRLDCLNHLSTTVPYHSDAPLSGKETESNSLPKVVVYWTSGELSLSLQTDATHQVSSVKCQVLQFSSLDKPTWFDELMLQQSYKFNFEITEGYVHIYISSKYTHIP